MATWIVWIGVGMLACGSSATPCEPPGTQVAKPRAAGCLTVHGEGLLMVQGQDGRWSIPGGYIDSGETSSEAAVRETFEEAGVKVAVGEPACAAPRTGFVAHACTVVGTAQPRPVDGETKAARFLTAEEIRGLADDALRFPDQRGAYLRVLGVQD